MTNLGETFTEGLMAQIATLTAERDGLKERLTFANAIIGALNGYRNQMANAFNQYGAFRGDVASEKAAAEMFWDADRKFSNWLTGDAKRQLQEESKL